MPAPSADPVPCYWGHTPQGDRCEKCGVDLLDQGAGLKIPGHKSRWSIDNKKAHQ